MQLQVDQIRRKSCDECDRRIDHCGLTDPGPPARALRSIVWQTRKDAVRASTNSSRRRFPIDSTIHFAYTLLVERRALQGHSD